MSVEPTGVLTAQQRLLSVAAVVVASFGVGVAFGIGYPLTALTLEGWQSPKWVLGVAGAAPAFAILMALPFLPRIVAAFGTARAIAIGCTIGGAGFLALAIVPNAALWIVVRIIMSAGLALPWLAGETWINAVVEDRMRGRVIAIYAIAFFCGFALGPLALSQLGTDGWAAFVAGAIGTALAGVPILMAARWAPEMPSDGHGLSRRVLALAPIAMVGGLMGGFAEITYFSLIPNVGLAAGLNEGEALQLLTTLTVGGIICQFPIGWLADKMERRRLIALMAVIFVVLSVALLPALGQGTTAYVLAFMLGGTILGFYTVGLAIIGETVPRRDLTAANAAFLVLYQAGAILGPLVAGAAMSLSPITGFVGAVSVMMVTAGALLFWADRVGGG